MSDDIDINEEMRKQPEDRKPGTDKALMREVLEFGRAQGAPISDEDEAEILKIMGDD